MESFNMLTVMAIWRLITKPNQNNLTDSEWDESDFSAKGKRGSRDRLDAVELRNQWQPIFISAYTEQVLASMSRFVPTTLPKHLYVIESPFERSAQERSECPGGRVGYTDMKQIKFSKYKCGSTYSQPFTKTKPAQSLEDTTYV